MLANVTRDAEVHDVVREISQGLYGPAFAELHAALAEGLEGKHAATAIELMTAFNTWRLLSRRSSLSREEAVDFAVRVVTCAG